MRKSRFTEARIIRMIKEQESPPDNPDSRETYCAIACVVSSVEVARPTPQTSSSPYAPRHPSTSSPS